MVDHLVSSFGVIIWCHHLVSSFGGTPLILSRSEFLISLKLSGSEFLIALDRALTINLSRVLHDRQLHGRQSPLPKIAF